MTSAEQTLPILGLEMLSKRTPAMNKLPKAPLSQEQRKNWCDGWIYYKSKDSVEALSWPLNFSGFGPSLLGWDVMCQGFAIVKSVWSCQHHESTWINNHYQQPFFQCFSLWFLWSNPAPSTPRKKCELFMVALPTRRTARHRWLRWLDPVLQERHYKGSSYSLMISLVILVDLQIDHNAW